jgi:trimethylamine--corrinoid protein Co-methyltransferase
MNQQTRPVSRTHHRGQRRERAAAGSATAERPNPLPPGLEGGRFRPLTESDVQRIHEAALSVLERTGVGIVESECRRLFAQAGARIDAARNRVYLPRPLVENALRMANRNVVFYSRDGRHDLQLRGKRVYLGTGGAAVKVLDLETGHARESVLRDVYDLGRLVETLDNIHFYLRPVVARDMGNDDIDINTFYACLAATNKHVMGSCYFPHKVAEIKRLVSLVAGSEAAFEARPFLSINFGIIVSPLRFAPETAETLTAAIRASIPVAIVAAPLNGATAPASLVGTLVQVMAEALAALTYVQLVRPGHPALVGSMPLVADLRTGNMIGGSAEMALMNAAAAQMCQFYDLPIYNSCGITESKVPDVQAGFEKGLTTAVTALAGANYNHHAAGMLESLLAVAYEQYVIDDDICGQIMRLVRGIEVTEESLSLNVIHDVCNGEGHYLGHEQTLALMQTESHYPHTADRRSRGDWENNGSLDMREAARRHARRVLESHSPQLVSDDLDDQIRSEFNILLPRGIMQPGSYP